ncbi:hypothetical protein Emed_005472 [Eimeria media]
MTPIELLRCSRIDSSSRSSSRSSSSSSGDEQSPCLARQEPRGRDRTPQYGQQQLQQQRLLQQQEDGFGVWLFASAASSLVLCLYLCCEARGHFLIVAPAKCMQPCAAAAAAAAAEYFVSVDVFVLYMGYVRRSHQTDSRLLRSVSGVSAPFSVQVTL